MDRRTRQNLERFAEFMAKMIEKYGYKILAEIPYGYRKENDELVQHPQEAEYDRHTNSKESQKQKCEVMEIQGNHSIEELTEQIKMVRKKNGIQSGGQFIGKRARTVAHGL